MAETHSVALLTSGAMGWSDIRNALASIPDVSIVASVSTAEELLDVAIRVPLAAVVMPARHGETSLLPLIPRLTQPSRRPCQVVILAFRFEPSELAEAISRGATGMFALEDLDMRDLPARLQSVILGGDMIMTTSVASMLRSDLIVRPSSLNSLPKLSGRQLLMIRDLADGLTRKEIALRRGLSVRTVDRTVSDLRQELDAASKEELIAKAAKAGLLR